MARNDQPIDELTQRIPDPRQEFTETWGGRLDEYEAKVQQVRLQSQQQHRATAADLESQLEQIRACVGSVAKAPGDTWMSMTERCEQMWHKFEQEYKKAAASVGGIADQPQSTGSEDTNCRGHGGQVGHQNTRQCPP